MAARLPHMRDQRAADMNSCQASWHKDLIIIHKNAWARLGGLGSPYTHSQPCALNAFVYAHPLTD